MANPSWFNEVEYLNGKLVQLNANGFKDANGNAFTSISQVADAITAGEMSAFEHYNMYGSKEGISPSNAFNAVEYCMFKLNSLRSTGPDAQKAEWAGKTWQDVQYEIHKSGMSLGEHYAEYGFVEGVPMSNAFDGNKYLEAKLALLQANEATSKDWTGKDVAALAAFFRDNGTDPYTHYLTFGGVEGEVPSGMSFKPEPVNPGGGVTEVLTTGVDTIAAGAKDTTFMASVVSGSTTFNAGDSLTGGAGNDTLVLDRQGDVIAGLQTVSGIENVVVYDDATTAGYKADMTQFAGMKSFSYTGPDAMTANFVDTVTDVTLNGAATASAVTGTGIANVSLKNMAVDTKVTVNNSTADHALKLTLEKVGNDADKELTLADATLGKLDIVSNGEMNSLIFDNNTAKLTAVTVAGKGDLDLDMNGSAAGSGGANVKSIDGSAAEGNLIISDVAAGTNSIKTGKGDDEITIKVGDMTAADKFEMGEGENTLMFTDGKLFNDKTADHMKGILASTGVDVLGTSVPVAAATGDSGSHSMVVDMGLFKDTSIDTFLISGSGTTTADSGYIGMAGAASADNTASDGGNGLLFTSNNSTLNITNSNDAALLFRGGVGGASSSATNTHHGGNGGNGVELQLAGNDTGNDAVTFNITGNATFQGAAGGSGSSGNGGNGGHGLDASAIDVLNLVLADSDSAVIFSGGASGATTAGTAGNAGAGVSIAAKGTINISGEADSVNLGTVYAGGNNTAGGAANTTIDATGFDGRVKVTTGLGNDTLTGGNGADELGGGLGVNTFTGNGGADKFVIGNAEDTDVVLTAVTDTITDFSRAEGDKINIASVTKSVAAQFAKATSAAADMTALLAAADTALTADVDYYVGWIGQNTYLIADANSTGITAVVELTGIANGDLNFTDLA